VNVSPLNNDSDINGDAMTITDVSDHPNANIELDTAQAVVYIEILDLNEALPTMSYTICDSFGACTSSTIVVYELVCPTPEPPLEVMVTTVNNQSIDFLLDASYLPADTIETSQFGMIIASDSGFATYVPPAGFTGLDSYTNQEVFVSECCGTWATGGVSIEFAVEVDTFVAIVPHSELDIIIAPNPFTDFISIETEENKELSLRLFDATGRMVHAENAVRQLNELGFLSPGVYLLEITIDDRKGIYKLIKN